MYTATSLATTYDAAVLGLGTMGSFAALELAKRGARVIGFDCFHPPHNHGSHSGSTRVFRIAYPEASGYSNLAQEAGALWDQINYETAAPVLTRCGMLYMGDGRDTFLADILESARLSNLAVEKLSASEVRKRYPAFQIPDNYSAVFDAKAGWINADAAIRYALDSARELGVELHLNTEVLSWRATETDECVDLHTASESIRAKKLIVTAGPWSASVLRDLNLPLRLRRKVLAWFKPIERALFEQSRIPVFTFPEKAIYGFPANGQGCVKLAEHLGGDEISSPLEVSDPIDQLDFQSIRETASKYMPALAGAWPGSDACITVAKICLYTMTPDQDFIVDLHPMHPQVVLAAGFSGHGFKFAPLVGKAIADLALFGKTLLPTRFMRLDRFSSNYGK